MLMLTAIDYAAARLRLGQQVIMNKRNYNSRVLMFYGRYAVG